MNSLGNLKLNKISDFINSDDVIDLFLDTLLKVSGVYVNPEQLYYNINKSNTFIDMQLSIDDNRNIDIVWINDTGKINNYPSYLNNKDYILNEFNYFNIRRIITAIEIKHYFYVYQIVSNYVESIVTIDEMSKG